jgi:exopolysaccharide production protein ExoQ
VSPASALSTGRALAAAALFAPSLAVFAPHGLAPLLGVVALVVLLGERRRCLERLRAMLWLVVLLAALSLWCFASVLWSIVPEHSLTEASRFALISLAGLLVFGAANGLESSGRERLRQAATIGFVIAAALILVERFSGAALTRLVVTPPSGTELFLSRFDRGAVVLVLSLWPAVGALRRSGLALAVAAAGIVAVMAMFSSAAKLALAVGIAAAIIAWRAPRLVAAALGGIFVLAAILLPLAVPDARTAVVLHEREPWIKPSGIHRLLIWRFTADRIAERPILGWGMDASRAVPGGHVNVGETVPGAGLGSAAEALPLHPHNAALQWEVELGVPGTLLALAVIVAALWICSRQEHLSARERAGALAWAAAALVFAMLSFGAWQEWWLAALWLTSATYAASITPAMPGCLGRAAGLPGDGRGAIRHPP